MRDNGLSGWSKACLVAGALVAVGTACSSTHIKSARQPAGMGVPPFRNVTVVGVDRDASVRTPFENDTAALLQQRGVAASPSYPQFSFDDIKGNKEQLRQKLVASGVESLLFVRITAQGDFVDGPPVSLGAMDMEAVDESAYVAFTTVGGEMNTSFRLGARLYRVSDGAVIWSAALGEIMKEDADAMAFIDRTAKLIVEQMAKDKVIP